MDVFPKFIIVDNSLIMMKVTYHHEILEYAEDKSTVKGGGWYRWDKWKDSFVFYGGSTDFGTATLEDIKECVANHMVFSNPYIDDSMTEQYNLAYDTGSEIIQLSQKPTL